MAHHMSSITALLLEYPVCVDCIAFTLNVAPGEVRAALETIGRSLELRREDARCSACDDTTTVWSLTRTYATG
jgi:hypothetical protein